MEHRAQYVTKEPNPTGIPARWLRFLYRMAGLEGGKMYHITLITPKDSGDEPQWGVEEGPKVENGR